jgi:hypothetical protein
MSKTKETKKSAPKEQPQVNPNQQVRWDPEAVIEITGIEFYHLNQIAQAFSPLVSISHSILDRMIKAGVATPNTGEPDSNTGMQKEEVLDSPKVAESKPSMSVVD